MIKLLGFIMTVSPIAFLFTLLDANADILDAIKFTIAVDLGIACVGLGVLIMADGGLLPL